MLWDLTNSWKAFPAPSGCGSIFPAKSCQDASRSGSWLARVRWVWQMRQNFVAQFVQLWVVVHVVGRCRENWALSLDRCQCCSFPCISSICCAFFSGVMVSRGFTKLQWIRGAAEHQTVTMTLYWCKFGFGKCFGASSWSSLALGSALEPPLGPTIELVIVSCIKSTFHHMSQSNREMVHCCCTE